MPLTLGERVLLWRNRQRLAQKELAPRININPISLSKIERGVVQELEASTARKLAQALGVKTDYLLGLVGEEEAEANYRLVLSEA
jgi:transcriptional regulator with XRE-family HTH domain